MLEYMVGGDMKRFILMICLIAALAFGCSDNEAVNNMPVEEAVDNTVTIVDEGIYGDFKGYLWEIKHGDAKVYLFGSVHLADKSIYPFHEDVEKAYESSDALVVEADVSDTAAIQASANMILLQAGDRVQNHLSQEGIDKFNQITEELGVDPSIFEKFKVWAVGSNLMSLQLMHGGYMGTNGVDMHFLERAQDDGKNIMELESVLFQLELFDDFTDEEQELMFFSSLGTIEETVADFEELYDYYILEDDAKMTDYLFSETSETSDMEDAILKDRNVGMADKIDKYLQTDQTYFVVVGLAHYLGEDSVVKYLENKGYTVERK